MRWRLAFLLVLLVGGWGLAPPAQAEVTAEQVREAIRQGINFLQSRQNPDGSWDDVGGYQEGMTALATLALLTCGEPPDEPHVARALERLRVLQPSRTYVAALQTMVLAKAGSRGDRVLIQRNATWLERSQLRNPGFQGAWTYQPPMGIGDNSNSQFALLALYEAERAGAKVNEYVWNAARGHWRTGQNADGSWGYLTTRPGTGSMTCAGITSLIIASGAARESDARAVRDRIQCCARGETDDAMAIQHGLEWLTRNFSVSRNPGDRVWGLYYLYGLERVGRLTGQRWIGQHDWYREGAEYLLQIKGNLAEAWQGTSQEEDTRIATALALLFLGKGRRPIVLAKLRQGEEKQWNAHRSDVANLTDYVGRQWQRDLGWQVIDLETASVDDLMQVPVLYFNGRRTPLPKRPQERNALAAKLRAYFERGGFLLAEANCGGAPFEEGFRELMKQVFPEPGYELRTLPPEHPIWHAEQPLAAEQVRPLLGIEFGCRTSVVFAPLDRQEVRPSLSCLWELARPGRGHPGSERVQAQIEGGLAIGINVLAYATNRELKFKDEIPTALPPLVHADPNGRGPIRIANVRHPGGCNAAPRALVNLLETSARELQLRVNLDPPEVALTDEALFDYPLVFMHGRNRFQLTDAERAQLKLYLERGGMILADAICSSEAFATAFRQEMAAIFPERPLEAIAGSDPLLTDRYGGSDVTTVTRRDPQATGAGGPLKTVLRKVPPELEAIRLGDRYAVLFSRYDLSCALERHGSLECQGYVAEDAARIGLNVLLYALQQ